MRNRALNPTHWVCVRRRSSHPLSVPGTWRGLAFCIKRQPDLVTCASPQALPPSAANVRNGYSQRKSRRASCNETWENANWSALKSKHIVQCGIRRCARLTVLMSVALPAVCSPRWRFGRDQRPILWQERLSNNLPRFQRISDAKSNTHGENVGEPAGSTE